MRGYSSIRKDKKRAFFFGPHHSVLGKEKKTYPGTGCQLPLLARTQIVSIRGILRKQEEWDKEVAATPKFV